MTRARSRAMLAATSLVVSTVILAGLRPEAGAVVAPAAPAAAPAIKVAPRTVEPRQNFTVTGRLPTQVVRKIVLLTRVNGRWRSAKTGQTKPNGTFRFKAKAPQRTGTVVLRVGAPRARVQGRRLRPITTKKAALIVRTTSLTPKPAPTATVTSTPTVRPSVRPTPIATATGTPRNTPTVRP